MMSTGELKFQEQVRAALAELSTSMVTALQALVDYRYPEQVAALDFEIFSDSFTSGFPARAFFLDRRNCEYFLMVNGQATYPSPVDPGLLDIDCVYPVELEDQLELESPGSDPWHIATEEFFQWFLGCWHMAGGRDFPLPATIAPHDSSSELDLITGRTQPRGCYFASSAHGSGT